jgi:hypothetical protein
MPEEIFFAGDYSPYLIKSPNRSSNDNGIDKFLKSLANSWHSGKRNDSLVFEIRGSV